MGVEEREDIGEGLRLPGAWPGEDGSLWRGSVSLDDDDDDDDSNDFLVAVAGLCSGSCAKCMESPLRVSKLRLQEHKNGDLGGVMIDLAEEDEGTLLTPLDALEVPVPL